ncbi:hypothetical protein HYW72_02605 [Candidatus Nomurabacteria bacterium]|nr:hypothetical protein [Candidatus Nomurabacteria bacterium]
MPSDKFPSGQTNKWDARILDIEKTFGPMSPEEKTKAKKVWEEVELEEAIRKEEDSERQAEGEERQRALDEEQKGKFDKI